MEAVPTLLSAASFARYRHGFFRVPHLPPGLPPVAVDCGGFVAGLAAPKQLPLLPTGRPLP
jgi:hypothetical protein